jgi:hypothetical protein
MPRGERRARQSTTHGPSQAATRVAKGGGAQFTGANARAVRVRAHSSGVVRRRVHGDRPDRPRAELNQRLEITVRMTHKFLGALCAVGVLAGFAGTAHAYPVDPAKVPVAVGQRPQADHDITLAYDSADQSIVYYAPKGGRVAIMNGLPLLGFATIPTGEGFLNAQLEFGVFGTEKQQLFDAITRAGYRPVALPYVKTAIVPVTPGFDVETNAPICVDITDESTGEVTQECDPTLFSAVSYSRKGPSLGEFVALSATLNKFGAAIYSQMLRGGNALQINLEADYYKAGTAFTAVVTVNYSKLFEQFHAYAAFHGGFCTDIQVETFWKNAGLCFNKPASECAVNVEYTDARGNHLNNVTVDPDQATQQKELLQAIDRLRDKLQDEMLTPLGPSIGPLDTSKPSFGFKLNASYERTNMQRHATFTFKSPNGVNIGHTVIPAGIACVAVSREGDVSRNTGGDCASYWAGTIGFREILAKQVNR